MNSDFMETAIGRIGIAESDGVVTGLYFGGNQLSESNTVSDSPLLDEAFRQLDAWLAGEIREFTLPMALEGSPFMLEVWKALREIPYGHTLTYRDVAARIASPNAARAVGMACARNPIPIFIPCHRVVCSDGRIGGYLGGPDLKRSLLDLERRYRA